MIGVRLFFISLLLLVLFFYISTPSSFQPELQEENATSTQMSETVEQKAEGVPNLPPSRHAPETKHAPSGEQDSHSDETLQDSINASSLDHLSVPTANDSNTNSTAADTTTANPSE